MKVLIVDDDRFQRKLLHNILMHSGYEVVERDDGATAWELLQRDRFPVVITDWLMPGMSGLELISRIRAANFETYTYIIIVTGLGSKKHVVRGLDAGADDYLIKPVDPEELRARVRIGERILSLEVRLRATLEHLYTLATYDSLTGLLNRRAIYERAQAELDRATREGNSMSLIMLDIDHFKRVNDAHGHLVGDQALRVAAGVLLQNKRSYDLAGRWGGEEFLLVLPDTTLMDAGVIAERIRKQVEDLRFPLPNGKHMQMTVSLGVSSVSMFDKRPTLGMLIQTADNALFRAKDMGRNIVCLGSLTKDESFDARLENSPAQ